jgi:hypothetical protein
MKHMRDLLNKLKNMITIELAQIKSLRNDASRYANSGFAYLVASFGLSENVYVTFLVTRLIFVNVFAVLMLMYYGLKVYVPLIGIFFSIKLFGMITDNLFQNAFRCSECNASLLFTLGYISAYFLWFVITLTIAALYQAFWNDLFSV